MTGAIITAGAALLGAIIGSAGTGIITFFQLRAERSRAEDARIFEARKSAFEKALAIFTHIRFERLKGESLSPDQFKEKYESELYLITGRLILYGSQNLLTKVRRFIAFFDNAVPSKNEDKQQERKAIATAWDEMVNQMRDELGFENLKNERTSGTGLI